MNNEKVIALCRQLIKAIDRPSAGIETWNADAEAAVQELRKELGDLNIAASLMRTLSLSVEVLQPVLDEARKLRRLADGYLAMQDGSKLDEMVAAASEALALIATLPGKTAGVPQAQEPKIVYAPPVASGLDPGILPNPLMAPVVVVKP